MKKKFLLGILIISFTILACSCSISKGNNSSTSSTKTPEFSSESSDTNFTGYLTALKNKLSKEVEKNINKIDVTYSKEVKEGYLSQFIFSTEDGENYEGSVYATYDSKKIWNIIYDDWNPIDTKLPFTHLESTSFLNEGPQYSIVSGVINDSNISYINIFYVNKLLVKVLPSLKYNTYAFIRTGALHGVAKIEAYSKEDKLIFKY